MKNEYHHRARRTDAADIWHFIHRYAGPKPPKGKTHTYQFTLYALDCSLELKVNTKKRSFLKKAEGHILQTGSITAKFE